MFLASRIRIGGRTCFRKRITHLMAKCLSTVLVYKGQGSCEESFSFLLQALESTVDNTQHSVQCITPQEIKAGSWTKNCRLIVFGGGYDLGFIAAVGQDGTRRIREFVQNGGSYLGLCAGGYWACDYIEFDKNGPLEVVGERFLKFYPGECIGPAFPGFQYGEKTGVHAVPIKYKGKQAFHSYIDGGGYFVSDAVILGSSDINSTSVQKCEVLATYSSLPNQRPAVLKCPVGQGMAILSGVHVEFAVHFLDKDNMYIKQCYPQFVSSEETRQQVFVDILEQLRIKTNNIRTKFSDTEIVDRKTGN